MGITTSLWHASPAVRRGAIAALLLLACLVSFLSVELRPAGAAVAAWWPAAGIGAAAVLASRGTRVGVATLVTIGAMVANALAGREWGLTIGYGIANGVEVWVVAWVLTRGGSIARLDGVRDIARFLIACVAGAATIAVIGGTTAWIVADQDWFVATLSLLSSHGSALLIALPLFIMSPRIGRQVNPGEILVQVTLLIGLTLFVFWPGNYLPIAFVPLVAILWAAFRLPTVIVALELLALGVTATTLTVLGGGPFALYADDGTRTTVVLLQLFLIVHGLAALFISGARNDWSRALARVEAQEDLLRGGIVNADSGILIAELIDGARFKVVGVNRAALDALDLETGLPDWHDPGLPVSRGVPLLGDRELDKLLRQGEGGQVELDRKGRRFDAQVSTRKAGPSTIVVTVVFTDVTERQEREDMAVQSMIRLRELNQQKDDFIAAVSHELRTPVTAIMGFSEQLADDDLSEGSRLAARVIDRNARRLADVIEDVLELSRLTSSGSTRRARTRVDVGTLVRQATEDAYGLAPSKSVIIATSVPTHPVIATIVAQDLQRVVANLLSNAVKFSPDNGRIDVTLRTSEGTGVLEVRDEGPGIPPDEMGLVWERFYRVQGDAHRDVPGTGLGLPIVKALTEQRLGGSIELESDGTRGTTARLTFPLWGEGDVDTRALNIVDAAERESEDEVAAP